MLTLHSRITNVPEVCMGMYKFFCNRCIYQYACYEDLQTKDFHIWKQSMQSWFADAKICHDGLKLFFSAICCNQTPDYLKRSSSRLGKTFSCKVRLYFLCSNMAYTWFQYIQTTGISNENEHSYLVTRPVATYICVESIQHTKKNTLNCVAGTCYTLFFGKRSCLQIASPSVAEPHCSAHSCAKGPMLRPPCL